jgi:translation initiation factor IF-3
LLIRFSEDLAPYGTAEGMPRLEGRNAHVLLSPVKASAHPPAKDKDKDKPKPPDAPSGKPN